MKIRAIIFDMDGLLLDTETIGHFAWKSAAKDLGHELKDETFHDMIGRNKNESHQILLRAFGNDFPIEKARELRNFYWDSYVKEKSINLMPGVLELLEKLSNMKIPKIVCTSTHRDKAIEHLTTKSIIGHFDELVTGDLVTRGKPAPDIYLLALKKLGIESTDCFALEDSENGVRAATSAGIRTLMIPDKKQPSEEIAKLAEKVFPSLQDAMPFILSQL